MEPHLLSDSPIGDPQRGLPGEREGYTGAHTHARPPRCCTLTLAFRGLGDTSGHTQGTPQAPRWTPSPPSLCSAEARTDKRTRASPPPRDTRPPLPLFRVHSRGAGVGEGGAGDLNSFLAVCPPTPKAATRAPSEAGPVRARRQALFGSGGFWAALPPTSSSKHAGFVLI